MKFNTIVLLFVSSTIALRIREEPAAAPVSAEKASAAIDKAAKGEEGASEAKDAEW